MHSPSGEFDRAQNYVARDVETKNNLEEVPYKILWSRVQPRGLFKNSSKLLLQTSIKIV
jgi:hypothetical protein